MPKGPKGEKRPADLNQRAAMIVKIASGEEDDYPGTVEISARKGGLKGGRARAAKLAPERRTEIAQKAAAARWRKGKAKAPK